MTGPFFPFGAKKKVFLVEHGGVPEGKKGGQAHQSVHAEGGTPAGGVMGNSLLPSEGVTSRGPKKKKKGKS